jgi:hypothetical protein
MASFGNVRKQRGSYFGRSERSTSMFGARGGDSRWVYSQQSISVEPEEHPLLPNADTFLKASYGDGEAIEKMRTLGYAYDKTLSNIETNVYVKEGRPLILHRGSSNAKDFLVSDVLLAVNLSGFDPRVWSAKKITRQAQEKYKSVADHCGHSWGGSLSEICADPMSWVLTYNKGASYYHIVKSISPRQLDIRTKGDLISLLSKYQNRNVITIDNKGRGFLAAHNLDNLD